ncbi:lipopolysaccharide cholinephosphotransferase [Clostridium moniliforme]|uniref:Lipopolysaccharide cholinephosphotransferase n=1 Tax=Clostridium moniliforme TaxID=39489 RepID=A0ABS4EYU0_9CLOT|nr:LicD family protein [Clostridium moniliforme]MBP1889161.1 lipopolysaccharide cholinephosphotransferase [Clostridium moniliforme]
MEYSQNELREVQVILVNMLKDVDKVCRENNIDYWLTAGTLLGAIRHKGFIPWDDDIDISMMREDYNKFMKIGKEKLNNKYFIQSIYSDKNSQNQFMKVRDRNSILKMNKREKGHTGIFIDIFPMDSFTKNDSKIFIKNKLMLKIRFYWMKYAKIKRPFFKNIKGNFIKILARIYFSINRDYDYKNINEELKMYLSNMKYDIENEDHIRYGIESVHNYIYHREDIFPLIDIEFEGYKFRAPNNYDKFLKTFFGDYMKLPKVEDRKPHHIMELKLKLTKEEYIKLNKNYFN